MKGPTCHVCGKKAFVEVFLYDVYLDIPQVTMARDFTCPFLCEEHLLENERLSHNEVDRYERDVTLGQIANAYEKLKPHFHHPAFSLAMRHASARPGAVSMAQVRDEQRRDEAEGVNTKVPAIREPRGVIHYPYSNQHRAQGFTIYRELA